MPKFSLYNESQAFYASRWFSLDPNIYHSMNGTDPICERQKKNKFVSSRISKRFKNAKNRRKAKSKNYKKQKMRRNCFVRQYFKQYISSEYQDYVGESLFVSQSIQCKSHLSKPFCELRLRVKCLQYHENLALTSMVHEYVGLRILNNDLSINIEYNPTDSTKSGELRVKEACAKYQYNCNWRIRKRQRSKRFDLIADYKWFHGDIHQSISHKKNCQSRPKQETWKMLQSQLIGAFGMDLTQYYLHHFIDATFPLCKKKESKYRHLFKLDEYKCDKKCYDVKDYMKEINDWLDRMFIETNYDNKDNNNINIDINLNNFSGDIYSMIVLDYLFELKDNLIHKNANYDGICWVELKVTCAITNQLWNDIESIYNFNHLKVDTVNILLDIDEFVFYESTGYNRSVDYYGLSYYRNKEKMLSRIKRHGIRLKFINYESSGLYGQWFSRLTCPRSPDIPRSISFVVYYLYPWMFQLDYRQEIASYVAQEVDDANDLEQVSEDSLDGFLIW